MDRAAYLPPVHHSYLPDELRSPAAAKMALSNLSGQIGTLRDPGGHFGNQNKPKATMADIYFPGTGDEAELGRAHVCTPVPNAHLVCRLLLDKNNTEGQ